MTKEQFMGRFDDVKEIKGLIYIGGCLYDLSARKAFSHIYHINITEQQQTLIKSDHPKLYIPYLNKFQGFEFLAGIDIPLFESAQTLSDFLEMGITQSEHNLNGMDRLARMGFTRIAIGMSSHNQYLLAKDEAEIICLALAAFQQVHTVYIMVPNGYIDDGLLTTSLHAAIEGFMDRSTFANFVRIGGKDENIQWQATWTGVDTIGVMDETALWHEV